jgi:hypothetical protein
MQSNNLKELFIKNYERQFQKYKINTFYNNLKIIKALFKKLTSIMVTIGFFKIYTKN